MLTLEGRPVRLVFDWRTIALLHAEFGDDWQERLERILVTADTRGLAAILAAGSGTLPDQWLDESPPIVTARDAIQRAFNVVFFGLEGVPDTTNPPTPGLIGRLREIWSKGRSRRG
jgi:hypothetical protein